MNDVVFNVDTSSQEWFALLKEAIPGKCETEQTLFSAVDQLNPHS